MGFSMTIQRERKATQRSQLVQTCLSLFRVVRNRWARRLAPFHVVDARVQAAVSAFRSTFPAARPALLDARWGCGRRSRAPLMPLPKPPRCPLDRLWSHHCQWRAAFWPPWQGKIPAGPRRHRQRRPKVAACQRWWRRLPSINGRSPQHDSPAVGSPRSKSKILRVTRSSCSPTPHRDRCGRALAAPE